jgi:CHAD domain-containing protein
MTTSIDSAIVKNVSGKIMLPINGALQVPGPDYKTTEHEAWEWSKLRKVARRQVDKFISLVPDTLRGGCIEAVNQMRITSRRLEQILDLLYPKPRPRRVRKLRRRLKECRHTLGELRNDDALLAMVEQAATLKSSSDAEVWSAVKEYLQGRRLQNASQALEKLGRINLTASYLKLKQDLDSNGPFRLAARNGNRAQMQLDGGKSLVKQRLTDSLDRLWRAFETSVEKSHSDPREKVIHQMRIAAKRLRYLTEAMEKLHVDGSSAIAAWLSTFQRIVGQWHDRELLEHAMTEMITQPNFRHDHPGLRAEVQSLILRNHEIKESLERKFSWMTKNSEHYKETREWVSQFLANGNGKGNGGRRVVAH